jgi:uroporphyrinogen III methyltransferase/synthase
MSAGSPPPPLAGLRVVVTRSSRQAGGLAAAFVAAGARVETLPLLEVVPPADPAPLRRAASELASYDWLVFTSANAVAAFLSLAATPWPPRVQVAAVGSATAAALRAQGVAPQLVAAAAAAPGPGEQGANAGDINTAGAAGLLELLALRLRSGEKVLLPQAADARPVLAPGLAAAGAETVAVVAYDKRLPAAAAARAAELFAAMPLGWVTFTSPRIVRHFAALFAEEWPRRRGELAAASIGGVTSAELRRHGVEPTAQAAHPADAALVEAVTKAVAHTTRLP